MTIEEKLNNALQGLPLVLANAAVNWTLDNFKMQGWENGRYPWIIRKTKDKKTTGRGLLIKSGRLRRGVQVVPVGQDYGFGVLGVPYGRVHDEGGIINHPGGPRKLTFKHYKKGKHKGKTLFSKNTKSASFSRKAQVGPYTIDIPQRKFIGVSPDLQKQLVAISKKYVNSRLK